MKKDRKFRFKFQDLISEIADRAQVLKLQGKNTVKGQMHQTVRVAATACGPQGSFRDVWTDSPPKQGALPVNPATTQEGCRYCLQDHQTEACNKLLAMNLQQRLEALKRAGFCFRCLTRGHMARECSQRQPPIRETCKRGHQSMLHNLVAQATVAAVALASRRP